MVKILVVILQSFLLFLIQNTGQDSCMPFEALKPVYKEKKIVFCFSFNSLTVLLFLFEV